MAYEYCRECCHELTVLDDVCPECGVPTGIRLTGACRLSMGELVGIGIQFFAIALLFTDYRPLGVDPGWMFVTGALVLIVAPHPR